MMFKEQVKPLRKSYNAAEIVLMWMDKIHSKWFKELSEEQQLLILDTLVYLEKQIDAKHVHDYQFSGLASLNTVAMFICICGKFKRVTPLVEEL